MSKKDFNIGPEAKGYTSGHYLGLTLNKERDQRLKDMATEMINWWPKEDYPLSKEEIFGLLIVLGYHMEKMFWDVDNSPIH